MACHLVHSASLASLSRLAERCLASGVLRPGGEAASCRTASASF